VALTQSSGGSGGLAFGIWNDRTGDGVADTVSANTTYQAVTDGVVVAYSTVGQSSGTDTLNGYTDSSTNPTMLVASESNVGIGITFPVRKGDYWKTLYMSGTGGTVTVKWLPLIPSSITSIVPSGYVGGGCYASNPSQSNSAPVNWGNATGAGVCNCPTGYTKQIANMTSTIPSNPSAWVCLKN
jgi:hypothetical protein